MKQLFIKYLLGISLLTTSACSVNVPPPDLYSDPDAITTIAAARSLLTSCYLTYPHYEYEFSVLGNDFCPSSLSGKDVQQQNFYNWQDKEISSFATDVWLAYYNTIANCDILLERMETVEESETDGHEKSYIIAEAKTLKAMCYFQLLRIFSSTYQNNEEGIILKSRVGLEFPARSSKTDCVAFIRTLLSEAVAVSHAVSQNGWLSQTAAYYLLAELELYAGNYKEAAHYAKLVMDQMPDGVMKTQNYSRLWDAASNNGRIFAFNTTSTYYSSIQYDSFEGDYFVINPAYYLTDGDSRKALNEYPMVMGGEERVLFGKYNLRNKKNQTISYIDQYRYVGALFIEAEALARQGQEVEARQLVNDYLIEMGATSIDSLKTGQYLLDAILFEKFREFIGEGSNWFDLKRLHKATVRLNRWGATASTTIKASDYRWTFPIPASEYKYNEKVTQNEGWPINR